VRRLGPVIVSIIVAGPLAGQATRPSRADRLVALYKQAVEARPVRGPAFDRLCALYDAGPGLDALVAEYEAVAGREPSRANLRLILGHLESQRGRPKRALAHYAEAVRLAPEDFTAQFSLGEANARAGNLDAAARALNAALDHARSDEQRRAALKRLGEVLARAHRWDDARAAWQRLVDLDPSDVAGRLELARSLERFQRYAEAIEVHRGVIRLPGVDPFRAAESWRRIGRLYERLDDVPRAVAAYESALDLTAPGSWLRRAVRREMAETCRAAGRLDWLARRYAGRIERPLAREDKSELLVALGEVLAELRRTDEAVGRFRQALVLTPGDSALRRRFADFLADRGRHAEAAEQLRHVVAARPEDADLQFELAEALLAAKRPDEAAAVWRRIDHDFAADRAVALRLAEAHRRHGRPNDAVATYRRLLDANAGDGEAARALAVLQHGLGQADAARATLRALMAARPDDVRVLLAAAEAFDELGLKDEAIAAHAQAVDLAPEDGQVLRGLAYALTAATLYDEALAAWQRVKRSAAAHLRAQADDQMLSIYVLQGRLDEARAQHERALRDRPADIEAGLFLAKIHLRRNDAINAIATYERLLKHVDDVRVRAALAAAYERQSLYERAREAYRALARLDRPNRRRHLRAVVTQCERLGDKAGAVAAARAIVAEAPGDAKAHAEVAEVYSHVKQFDKALAAYDEAIRLAPREFGYVDAKARVLDALGRLDDAMALHRRVLRTSANLFALKQAVRELLRLAPTREALEDVAACIRLRIRRQPSEWVLHAMLADVYRSLGETSRVRDVLREGLRQASDRSAALQALMVHCERHGPLRDAVAYGEELLARTTEPTAAQYEHLIELLLRAGRAARANRLAERMVSRQPADAATYHALAALFAGHGQAAVAAHFLDGLLTLTPDDMDARLRLARLREATGEFEAAADAYRRVVDAPAPPPTGAKQTAPSPAAVRNEAFDGLIRTTRARSGLPALVAEFASRLDRAPRDEQAHRDYVAVCEALGDADKTIAAHQRAARTWPTSPIWQGHLAQTARRLGRWRVASDAFQRLAEIDEADAGKHLCDAVRVLLAAGAEADVDRLIEKRLMRPDIRPGVRIEVAGALQEAGEADRAAGLMVPLVEQPDTARRYGRVLGDLLTGAGRRDAAIKAYLARFEKPLGPGFDEVWPSLEARRAALRAAWPLMKPADRQALDERVKAAAAASPDSRDAHEQLAIIAEQMSRTDERLAALDRLLALVPADANLPYQVIDMLRRLRRPKAAYRLAEQLVRRAEDGHARRDVCLRLINTYSGQDPGDELVGLIVRTYLADAPTAADYRNVAAVVVRWGRIPRGIALLKRALKQDPADRHGLRRQLADLYRRTGQIQALRALNDEMVRSTHLPPAPAAARSGLYAAREARLLPVIEVYRQANRMAALVAAAERRRVQEPDRAFAAYDLAIVYRHAGRADRALAVLLDLARRSPADPAVQDALGQALMRAGRFEEAVTTYRRLLRLAPTQAKSAYRHLAECYAQLERPRERLAVLEDLGARFRDGEAYLELAQAYRRAGEPQKARRAFQRYLDTHGRGAPGSEYDAYRRLARFLASMKDVDGAIGVLDDGARRVRLLHKGAVQARLLNEELIDLCAEAGRLPEVVKRFETELKDRPHAADLLDLIALALRREGRFAEEVQYRKRLADLAPADLDRQAALARAHADAGQYQQAVQAYETLAARDPARAAVHLANAADALFRSGTRGRAVETWWSAARQGHRANRGTELYRSAHAYYQLAMTFESHGLLDEAERAFLRALKGAARPTYDLYGGAVRLLVRRGKSAKALKVAGNGLERTGPGPERTSLIQALLPYGRDKAALLRTMAESLAGLAVLATDDELAIEVHRTIGERFTSIGDAARAAHAYAEALRRRPADVGLKRTLADTWAAAGRDDRAIPLYRAILGDNPDAYTVLDALAAALVRQRKQDEAVRLWEAVLERSGSNATACRLAGAFFQRQKDLDRAVRALELAVRAEPTNVANHAALAEAERRRHNYPAAIKALEAARRYVRRDAQARAIERALLNLYDEAKMLPRLITERQRAIERTHADLVAATLALAQALERADLTAEARATYQRVIHLAPDSPAAATARQRLAALAP